jgi:hypothetical protein
VLQFSMQTKPCLPVLLVTILPGLHAGLEIENVCDIGYSYAGADMVDDGERMLQISIQTGRVKLDRYFPLNISPRAS